MRNINKTEAIVLLIAGTGIGYLINGISGAVIMFVGLGILWTIKGSFKD